MNLAPTICSSRASRTPDAHPEPPEHHSTADQIPLQALTEAAKSEDQNYSIFQSCYALILFGVPNKGLEGQSLEFMVKGQPNAELLEDLKASSDCEDSATYATPDSPDDVFSIDLNHSEMVKFDSSACQHYHKVSARVVRLMQDAEEVIKRRFVRKDGMWSLL